MAILSSLYTGSFETTGSFGRVDVVDNVSAESFTGIFEGALSSSAQIDDAISGSLGANASTIRSLTKDGISGSLGSNATEIRSLTKVGISGSLGDNADTIRSLTKVGISGSLGPNATDIRTFTKTGISGSFVQPSASFSTRVSANESLLDQSVKIDAKPTFSGLTIQGKLTTQELVVSSSVTSMSVQQASGSTKFGDTSDDTHQFTGSIFSSGSVTAPSFTGTFSGALSSSVQIADAITGSFFAPSSSFSTRVTANSQSLATRIQTEEENVNQLQTDSASFSNRVDSLVTDSGSFSTRITDLKTDSGSFATRVTNLKTDSGSFSTRVTDLKTDSGSFSTRVTTNEGFLNQSVKTDASPTFAGLTSTGDVIVQGALTAKELIVSSSVTNMTVAEKSGSTIFGDSTDDTHQFTGSVFISSSLDVGKTGSFSRVETTKIKYGGTDLTATAAEINFLSGVPSDVKEAYDGVAYATDTGIITFTELDGGTDTIDIGVGTGDSPSFTGLTISGLTNSKLLGVNGSGVVGEKDLNDFVNGTTNQISVADDSSGGVTLTLPQSIATTSNVQFNHITGSGNISGSLTGSFGRVEASVLAGHSPITVDATELILESPLTANSNISSSAIISTSDMRLGNTTAGRILFTDSNGTITDDSDLSFNTDTLTATKIGAFQAVGAIDFNTQAMTNVDINSGAIDNVIIGGNTAVAGTFTTLIATTLGGALDANNQAITNIDIDSGDISGTDINVTGQTLTLDNDQISGDKVEGGTIDSTTITTLANTTLTSTTIKDFTKVSGSASSTGSFGRVDTDDMRIRNDLTVDGTLTAQVIQTEYQNVSVIFESGSTQFGDTHDDTHQFTGSISFSGSLNANLTSTSSFGNVTASHYYGDGSHLTGIPTYTVANSANNRIITSVDSTNGNAEEFLTFDGTTLSGTTASFGHIQIPDNGRLSIGSSDDLQLYHDGNNSYIKDAGTGNLNYLGGTQIFQNAAENKTMMTLNAASSVELRYNNIKTFETTLGGVSISGDITGSGNISGSSTSTASFGEVSINGSGTLLKANSNFNVDDSTTGILFSVQDISGFSLLEVSQSGLVQLSKQNVKVSSAGIEVISGKVSGSAVSTGSFGKIEASGLPLSIGSTNVGIGIPSPASHTTLKVKGRSEIDGLLVVSSSAIPVASASLKLIGTGSIFEVKSKIDSPLLKIDDASLGTLFSVNDISGIPLLEVSSSGLLQLSKQNVKVDSSGIAIVSGNVSGSSTSTGSFGRLETTFGEVHTLQARRFRGFSPIHFEDGAVLSGSFILSQSVDVSGSSTSTGSFGRVFSADDIELKGNAVIFNISDGFVTNAGGAMTIQGTGNVVLDAGAGADEVTLSTTALTSTVPITVDGNISGSGTSTGSFGRVTVPTAKNGVNIGAIPSNWTSELNILGTQSTTGIKIQAPSSGDAQIKMYSNAGGSNNDFWYIQATNGGTFDIVNYGPGSFTNMVSIAANTGNMTVRGNVSGSATSTISAGDYRSLNNTIFVDGSAKTFGIGKAAYGSVGTVGAWFSDLAGSGGFAQIAVNGSNATLNLSQVGSGELIKGYDNTTLTFTLGQDGSIVSSAGATIGGLIQGYGVQVTNTGGPELKNATPTATNPTIVPSRGDANTGIGYGGANGSTADNINLITGGTTGLYIDSSQDVVIPAGNLSITDQNGLTLTHSSQLNYIKFKDSTDRAHLGFSGGSDDNFNIWIQENGHIQFATNNTYRMQISSTGNVGIGTTSPNRPFHVYQGTVGDKIAVFQTVGSGHTQGIVVGDGTDGTDGKGLHIGYGQQIDNGYIDAYDWDGGAYQKLKINDYFTFNAQSGLGINQTSPSHKLDVTGDGRFTTNLIVGGNISGSATSTGSFGHLNIPGNAVIGGTITAQEFRTEFVNDIVIETSGSTKFGNSSDDIHQFTGSINLDGKSTSGVTTPFSVKGGTGTSAGGLQFGAYDANFGGIWPTSVTPASSNYALVARGTRTVLNSTTDIGLYKNDATVLLFANSDGVAIGGDNLFPSYKLDVTGTGRFTQNLTLGGNLVGDDATNISGINNITTLGNISGSSTSTGSFGYGIYDGNVGIGTTNTRGRRLTIEAAADTTNDQLLYLKQTPDNYGWSFNINGSQTGTLHIKNVANGTESDVLMLKQNGNVGVGNTNPSVALDVTGQINASTNIVAMTALYGNELITRSGNYLTVKTAGGSPITTFTSTGRVGIGSTNPEGLLHILTADASIAPNANADELIVENSGNAGISILSGNTSIGSIYFGDAQDNNIGMIDYNHELNKLSFTAGATSLPVFSVTSNTAEFGPSILKVSGSATSTGSFGALRIGDNFDSPAHFADDLVIGRSGNAGLTIRSDSANGYIAFADGTGASDAGYRGQIQYLHGTDKMLLITAGQNRALIDSSAIEFPTANYKISGSATSTGSFGKLLGDGSEITGISTTPFPFTGSAGISGSLSIDRQAATTGSTILDVKGSQGTLFSVVDNMSGSIFSANTVAGIPVIEAFSDGTVHIGPNVTGGTFGKLFVNDSQIAVGGGTGFPFTGSAGLSGSLEVKHLGAATGSTLLSVNGSEGTLFSVVNSMSGSIFSANTVAGIPVIEAFSDGKVEFGPLTKVISGSGVSTGSFGKLFVGGSEVTVGDSFSKVGISGSFTSTSSSLASRIATIDAAGSGITISNNVNNRVLTGDGSNANAEQFLTFNGTSLAINTYEIQNPDSSTVTLNAADEDITTVINGVGGASNGGSFTVGDSKSFFTSQNVGIGTDNPGDPLRVRVGTNQNLGFNSSGGVFRLSAYNDAVSANVPLLINASYIRIANNNSEVVRIIGGDVGIGHNTPSEKLHVNGNVKADGNITATGNLEAFGDIIARNLIISSSVTRMTQSFSSGSTIFGDSLDDTHKFTGSLDIVMSGSDALTIEGNTGTLLNITDSQTGSLFNVNDVSGVPIFDVDSNDTITMGQFSSPIRVLTDGSGNTMISGSATSTAKFGQFTEASSIAFKTNVETLENPLDKISKLRGVTYNLKANNEPSIGMIAEEVNEVFPELVDRDDNGKPQAMSYTRMTAVLLEAVKELTEEVKELKKANIYNKYKDKE